MVREEEEGYQVLQGEVARGEPGAADAEHEDEGALQGDVGGGSDQGLVGRGACAGLVSGPGLAGDGLLLAPLGAADLDRPDRAYRPLQSRA